MTHSASSSDPASPHPISPTAAALGGMLSLAAGLGIGRFVYTPILPYMVEGLGLSMAESGVIASANFLGYLAGALAAAGRFLPGGRRRWFLAAFAVSALSTGAMALPSTVPPFIVLRFVGGAASAYVMVLGAALVLERLAAAGRPGLSALHFAGVGSGIAVSSVLVTALAEAGWQAQWLASGALSLLALAAVVWLIPPASEHEGPGRGVAGASVARGLPALVVAYGLFGFGYVITATFISTMVRASEALRPAEPVVWLVVGVAAIPSVLLWGWLGGRWGNARAFALAAILQGVGVVLSVSGWGPWAVIVAAVLLGSTVIGLTALGLIQARELSRGDPRRSMAVMTASFGLGQAIGPTFAGVLYDMSGSLLLPSLCAAGALGVAALLTGGQAKPAAGAAG